MVRMQSIDLKSSVATTQDGSYMGLSTTDKNIIRALRNINEAFKIGNTHIKLVYDGSNLEIRADIHKYEYCDMLEEYKDVKIIGIDKKEERRTVKERTVKDLIKEIDNMNKKEKRKRKRREKKTEKETSGKSVSKPAIVKETIVKPKRKRRTKAEMEAAKNLVTELSPKEDTDKNVTKETIVKPKRKRRTKAEMEAAKLSLNNEPEVVEEKEVKTIKPKRKRRTKAEMEAAKFLENERAKKS